MLQNPAVHTEFETEKGKRKNGIIIFPAGGLRHQNYCTMPVWSGRWKRCTGCRMFISGKITAVWMTGISSKRDKERTASNRSMSKIMFDCLLNPYSISDILEN